MTKPRDARSTGGKRFYTWRMERYWSVTTILSALPKDALINWAKKYTAEYAVANVDTLVKMLEADDGVAGAVDWLKNASFRARDKAADLGTYVHEAAEAYALGKPWPAEYPPEAVGRMDSFKQFLDEHKPVYLATEASVYNRTQRYAGTLDAIVKIGDRTLLLDTKTRGGTNYPVSGQTKGDVYPDDALQLAAYRHAEFIGAPDGSEAPMMATDGAAVLHLTNDGYRLVEVDAGEEAFRVFLYVREVFRWKTDTSKRAVLGDYPATLEAAGMAAKEVAA